MRPILLVVLLCAAAHAGGPKKPPKDEPKKDDDVSLAGLGFLEYSATDSKNEALMQDRLLQKAGIVTTPPGAGAPKPPTWEEREAERREAYDKQFGAGAYDKWIGFYDHCTSEIGCDKTRVAPMLGGADDFVALRKDVEAKKVADGSAQYEQRLGQVKAQVGGVLQDLRPRDRTPEPYVRDFMRASKPVVQRIFSPEEARRFYAQTAAETRSPAAQAGLGQVLLEQGLPDRAKAVFDQALEEDPRQVDALVGRAQTLYALRDYPGAARDAAQALRLDPRNEEARAALGLTEGRVSGGTFETLTAGVPKAPAFSGLPDLPAEDAAAPAAITPERAAAVGAADVEKARQAAAYVSDARRALSLQDVARASSLLEKALQLAPKSVAALALQATAYARLKQYPQALAAAAAGLALSPDNRLLLSAQALALTKTGDARAALAVTEKLITSDPRDAGARYLRSMALASLGERQESLAEMARAAELEPQRFKPLYEQMVQLSREQDLSLLFEEPAAPRRSLPWVPISAGALVALVLVWLASNRKPAPRPLGLLGGNYEVGESLGGGAYLGKDLALGRKVVIKRLRLSGDRRRRFLDGARAAAQLTHANVGRIFGIFEHGDEVFVVGERADGRSLAQVLGAQGRLPLGQALKVLKGAAAGLDHAHGRGVLHGGLKPSNVMIEPSGVRLVDFASSAQASTREADLDDFAACVRAAAQLPPEAEALLRKRWASAGALVASLEALLPSAKNR